MYTLPPEWHPQAAIQLTWPHEATDWHYMLAEADDCFCHISDTIAARQQLIVVAPSFPESLKGKPYKDRIAFVPCLTNDTWARDHAFITLTDGGDSPLLLDFCFNGWGMKFAACLDNLINSRLRDAHLLRGTYTDCRDFVLEGGSVESDGRGSLLTTSACLLAPNRNDTLSRTQIEKYLTRRFGIRQVLWLDFGLLAGDDTDGHIDTLARFCPDDTIAYVRQTDPNDEHYRPLLDMERQLMTFRTAGGKPYRLLPLPMPQAIFDEHGQRLPATYANFLVMNGAVLYPTYAQPDLDRQAARVLAQAFPGREIVGIDCRALIRQHGSLHCVTMQYPIETQIR